MNQNKKSIRRDAGAKKRAAWLADLSPQLRYVTHPEVPRKAALGTHETESHALKRLGWR